jgi:pimeloyl-ACP methyl ester carboxylesterase
MFKPAFSALADIAQLIYYDHRGQGRSDKDPIVPVSLSETMAGCRPQHLVRFERFENCGHGVHRDDPERAFRVLREFILS